MVISAKKSNFPLQIMQMRLLVIFFVTSFFISGCANSELTTESNLLGTWRLYDIEQPKDSSKSGDDFSSIADLKEIVKEGETLSFFEDESFSDIKGEGIYTTGNWHFLKKNNSLSLIKAGKTSSPVLIKIEKNATGKQVLSLLTEDKSLLVKYIKEAVPLKTFTNDPFHKTNNQWRIKPAQAEDSAQLTSRLTNYLKHLAFILKAAQERKLEIVSFEFSQGPVKIYNGGIGAHPYDIVPAMWKKCFYNEADAFTTYRSYEKYLMNNHYKGAGTGDWIEDDYNILLSIYSGINRSK
jgi:hypothetical protein